MDLSLSGEQEMLRDALGRYLAAEYPFAERQRRVRAGQPDTRLWRELADRLGILGATLPERAGGLGGGAVEAMIVQEALGRALVIEPYLETVVLAGGLLDAGGGAAADDALARIGAGEARVAVALGERHARDTLHAIRTRATADGAGWRLSGEKPVVVGAPAASHLLLLARTAGEDRDAHGLSLFLVPADAPGIARHDVRLIDERPAADLVLTAVAADEAALVGPRDGALPLVERAMDAAVAALAAEAVGVMRQMVDDTVAYTRQRRQFGQPLSAFQVLQHRMVDMLIATEEAAAAALLAALKLDRPASERARATSAAKATIARTIRFVAQNAVQLHGGMGLTEELAVGHFFKRATVIERQFGGEDHHLARYAAASRTA